MHVARQWWTERTWLKRLAIGAGGLVALIVAAAFVLTQVVDPNAYRGTIERQVSAATGRAFHLQGDIELSFFPWLALTTGEGELLAPRGFSEPRFLRWRKAHVAVRLLPLLRGSLVVDRVRLVGLDARLVRAADGRTNWSFGSGPRDAGTQGAWPDIAGIELRDSQLDYVDDKAGMRLRLASLRVAVEPVREHAPMRIALAATASMAGHEERIAVEAGVVASLGPTITLDDLQASGRLLGARFGTRGASWHLAAPRLRLDPEGGAYEAPKWELGFSDAVLTGSTTARMGAATAVLGTLALAPVSLRATLAAAGVELPPTRDPRAFQRLSLGARYRIEGDALQVEPLDILLDDTRFAGRVTREAGILHFTLHGDAMDLDRYLKPEGTASEPFVLPVDMLRALRVAGTLDLDEATLAGVRMKGVRLGAGP